MKNYLNLGCGSRFHDSWTNVDFVASGPSVLCHDLRKGIPFPDESFEVVYHSHLLEHFPKAEAAEFLRECFRVLKPGGIIRIAIPDLERIARVYLHALEEAHRGTEEWKHNYEWIMLELYDQTVRERSGGEMAAYLGRENLSNEDFVLDRIGMEGRQIIEGAARARQSPPAELKPVPQSGGYLSHLYRLLRDPAFRREWMARRALGKEYELLQLARFRRGGELHLWMYDRYSLSQVLEETGFQDPTMMAPTESRIPGWKDFQLDTAPDGQIYKPDSLYMEALK